MTFWMRCESTLGRRPLMPVAGAVIAPLTQIFLSTKTFKVPTIPSETTDVMDIMDYFADAEDPTYLQGWEGKDNNRVSLQTRNLLTSTSNADPQPRIWQERYNCSWSAQSESGKGLSDVCKIGGATFGVLSLLKEPYLAQLPTDYSNFLSIVIATQTN